MKKFDCLLLSSACGFGSCLCANKFNFAFRKGLQESIKQEEQKKRFTVKEKLSSHETARNAKDKYVLICQNREIP